MSVIRERYKSIKKDIGKMSVNQVKTLLDNTYYQGANDIGKYVEDVLKEEFGFGKQKLKRFEEALNNKIKANS